MIYEKIVGYLNPEQERLIFRLKEGDLSVKRFLKVGSGKLIATPKHPEGEYLDKAAFETDFQNHLYGPNELETYPRWGICGKENLVLLDFDKQQIFDILKQRLPETFEVTSPRRGLPHRYYIVCGKQVPNLKFHIPGDTYVNAKGATVKNPSGEVRADNHYLVAPGTTIRYEENGIWKTGEYKITKDVPLARLEFEDFMKAVQGYLMEAAEERVLTNEKLFNGVSVGERHDTIFRYACRLIGDNPEGGFPANLALEMLRRFNNAKLYDEHGLAAPVEDDFCIRVIKEALEKSAKSSNIPIEKIAELGFTTIKERTTKGEDFKAKDGLLEPTKQEDVPNDKVNEYLSQGYEVTKQYETHAIMVKKALVNEKKQENTEGQKESQADRLIKYCLSQSQEVELFYDQHKNPQIRVKILCGNCGTCGICKTFTDALSFSKGVKEVKERELDAVKVSDNAQVAQVTQFKYEILPLGGSYFRDWLARLMWEFEEKTPGNDAIKSAVNVLRGKALLEGKQYFLYNRIAPADNGFWLDLADKRNRAILVTAEGWKVVENPPILFRRYNHQLSIQEPAKTGDAWKILTFMNLDGDENTKLSLICTIISYFVPLIAHPGIVVSGPQGSAKSWLLRLIKQLIDPSSIELLSIPKDERELAQQLDHHWIAAYDNITYLPKWASDTLCKGVTGGGIAVRKLYTDDEDTILTFKRCIMLNGINVAAQKGDLLDRAILVPLKTISPEVRKSEKTLLKDFEQQKSEILAGCLNTLVEAYKQYPNIKRESLQRLADFDEYGCAIAIALGKTQADFVNAYAKKVEQQNEEALNADPLALVILKFCELQVKGKSLVSYDGKPELDCWRGQPTELYQKLTLNAQQIGIDVKSKEWPKNPSALSRRLNPIVPALKAFGCIITSYEGTPRQIQIDASKLKPEPSSKERITCTYDFIKQKHREIGPFDLSLVADQDSLKILLREGKVFETKPGIIMPTEV